MSTILILALSVTCIYLVANIMLVIIRNYKAHQFYIKKSPKLPTVPNPNIFSGHLFDIIAPDKNWKIIEDLHDKYGPTFGYYVADQAWVSTKDIDLIKLILVDRAHKHTDRAQFGLPLTQFNHSILQINGEKWTKVRRVVAPALTNHKVRSDVVTADIDYVIDRLSQSLDRKLYKQNGNNNLKLDNSFIINVRDMAERFALAVIFLVTYKRPDEIDFDADRDEWAHELDKSARSITNLIVQMSMLFPFLRPACEFLVQFHPIGQITSRIVDYIVEATDINLVAREGHANMATKEDQRTIESFSDVKTYGKFKRRLVDTIIDGFMDKKISYDNFIGTLYFLLLAGSMTTADTITCLLWQLAKNPDIQEKLRKTILEKGIDSDYVMWCINETVRWHPAAPLGAGRVLGEDVSINGTFLAKGTFVMTTTHAIHHDPSIWPEPERFNPERWQNSSNFHPAAFVGFGLGPRNCVGGKLAIHEIKLISKMILTKYRVETCDQTPDEFRFSSPGMVFTLNDDKIMLRFNSIIDKDTNQGSV